MFTWTNVKQNCRFLLDVAPLVIGLQTGQEQAGYRKKSSRGSDESFQVCLCQAMLWDITSP
jgi:hypothetical protein